MRDQITTRVCFQVARREISRTVVYRPGAELTLAPHCVWCSAGVARPGHGLTMDGRLQAYYLDKQVMIDLARRGQPVSNAAKKTCEGQPITPRTINFVYSSSNSNNC